MPKYRIDYTCSYEGHVIVEAPDAGSAVAAMNARMEDAGDKFDIPQPRDEFTGLDVEDVSLARGADAGCEAELS